MEQRPEELLEEAIVRGYEELAKMAVGSAEYNTQVANLEKLGKMHAAIEQRTFDASQAAMNRGLETEKMEHEAAMKKSEERQNWIKTGADVVKYGALLVANSVWMKQIMKFEETGTIATKAFGFLHKPKFF